MSKIDLNKQTKTAGAYVIYKGLFPFQVGPTQEGNKLGVVRLGGHKDPNETPLETPSVKYTKKLL